jgi:hypothetical protein
MDAMRTDPTDNGGMFLGRRPADRRVHFRAAPETRGETRRRADEWLARCLLAGIVLVSVTCWVPITIACLWTGSEVDSFSGSLFFGIIAVVLALSALLFAALFALSCLDDAWVLVRRAAGFDQRAGGLGRVVAASAAIYAVALLFWFVVLTGPG